MLLELRICDDNREGKRNLEDQNGRWKRFLIPFTQFRVGEIIGQMMILEDFYLGRFRTVQIGQFDHKWTRPG